MSPVLTLVTGRWRSIGSKVISAKVTWPSNAVWTWMVAGRHCVNISTNQWAASTLTQSPSITYVYARSFGWSKVPSSCNQTLHVSSRIILTFYWWIERPAFFVFKQLSTHMQSFYSGCNCQCCSAVVCDVAKSSHCQVAAEIQNTGIMDIWQQCFSNWCLSSYSILWVLLNMASNLSEMVYLQLTETTVQLQCTRHLSEIVCLQLTETTVQCTRFLHILCWITGKCAAKLMLDNVVLCIVPVTSVIMMC